MTSRAIPEPVGGWGEPWPRVFEIASALPENRWALVGGLMVQAHALAVGVETNRVTTDVDVAVRIEARAFRYSDAASALLRLGYALDDSPRLTYRFVRGSEVVDLMVADHEHPPPRYARRDVMAVTGGRQALTRLERMRFDSGSTTVTVPLPTLHGALVLKAAAHMVDSRDRDRHLLDAITLLACITDLAPMIDDLRGSDRKRLTHLIRSLDECPLVAAQSPSDPLLLARRTAEELRDGLRL
jgi:hypothetical protein